MLDGNLKGQIGYSMIKGIASALDEKMKILIDAEEGYEPQEEESFAEVAMPEIEAMAQAVLEGCVDFSKIHFWEACETAEIAWEETQGEDGESPQRIPYAEPVEEPRPGNRILSNLEQINLWLEKCTKFTRIKGWDGFLPMDARRMGSRPLIRELNLSSPCPRPLPTSRTTSICRVLFSTYSLLVVYTLCTRLVIEQSNSQGMVSACSAKLAREEFRLPAVRSELRFLLIPG